MGITYGNKSFILCTVQLNLSTFVTSLLPICEIFYIHRIVIEIVFKVSFCDHWNRGELYFSLWLYTSNFYQESDIYSNRKLVIKFACIFDQRGYTFAFQLFQLAYCCLGIYTVANLCVLVYLLFSFIFANVYVLGYYLLLLLQTCMCLSIVIIFLLVTCLFIKNFSRELQLEARWRLWWMGQPVCCILLEKKAWHLWQRTLWNWQLMLRRDWPWERKDMRGWKRGLWSTICHRELHWFWKKFYGSLGNRL